MYIFIVKKLSFNGRKISVYKTKVKKYEEGDPIKDEEAFVIVKYLYDEGFIDGDNIVCEIIHEE